MWIFGVEKLSCTSHAHLQVAVLCVSPQSSVVLEVRDHFGSHTQPDQSHFLGKAELWVQDFLTLDWEW